MKDYIKKKYRHKESVENVNLLLVNYVAKSKIQDSKPNGHDGYDSRKFESSMAASSSNFMSRQISEEPIAANYVENICNKKEKTGKQFVFTAAFTYDKDGIHLETNTEGDHKDFFEVVAHQAIKKILEMVKEVSPLTYIAIRIPYEVGKNLIDFFRWYKKMRSELKKMKKAKTSVKRAIFANDFSERAASEEIRPSKAVLTSLQRIPSVEEVQQELQRHFSEREFKKIRSFSESD
ncbi:hypothetical protein M153_1310005524 [Pseudoloma neurophilia]|uniref:Uncharacterized protein n=1 Tax=Pseudoloma neurophilia TaxID=146866 RepID=A0A0R0M3X3_9MICR|nr:hypothetical protein M153_1310005524 [Pseudoloma neurophilia]